MLFNSFIYLLLFLPVVTGFYLWLNSKRLIIPAKIWLVVASLFFYAYWKIDFLSIIIASIVVNYITGIFLSKRIDINERPDTDKKDRIKKKAVLFFGIAFNVGLLGYFKYADFFIANVNQVVGSMIPLPEITLPLGISFFTFQQISYLVDSFHGKTGEYNFLNYALFVSFFPQLIAGPIVHHKEMMPQFARLKNKFLDWRNIYAGLFLIGAGLCKKVIIADTFGLWVSQGFSNPENLNFLTAWAASLSYTVQLYFDFSGYTDMAIGSALLINIRLPQNFNAPYRSLNIQEFWRRWHITLGRFLRDYIYIPLGGNRKGTKRVYINLFITFFIGGVWHGAGWTFVMWGAMHGFALCLHRVWTKMGLRLPAIPAWLLTFLFVNCAWVIFRAKDLVQAKTILAHMVNVRSANWEMLTPGNIINASGLNVWLFLLLLLLVFQDTIYKTTQEWSKKLKPRMAWSLATASAFVVSFILLMNQNRFSEFIYFQF
jgi:D-alanyl-lipoteichoic acid acyltransferase DltB (MBOAT superfamily)